MNIFDWLAASAVEEPDIPGEKEREHHVDLRQAAGEVPDHRPRQQSCSRSVMPPTFIRLAVSRKNGHRQEDEGVVGVEGLLHERHGGEPGLDAPASAGMLSPARRRPARAGTTGRKNRPNRMRDASAGREQCSGHGNCSPARAPSVSNRCWRVTRSCPISTSQLVPHLLAEEDEPGHAGDRPGDVDEPQRQLGQFRYPVPGEPGELDAGPDEYQRNNENAEPGDQPKRRLGAPRTPLAICRLRNAWTLANADHGADHHRPDQEKTRHFLGPDVAGDEIAVKRENICSVTGTIEDCGRGH